MSQNYVHSDIFAYLPVEPARPPLQGEEHQYRRPHPPRRAERHRAQGWGHLPLGTKMNKGGQKKALLCHLVLPLFCRPLFLPIPTSIRAYWGQSLEHCTPQPITGDFFDVFSVGVPTVLWSVQVPHHWQSHFYSCGSPQTERGKGDEEVGRVGVVCS